MLRKKTLLLIAGIGAVPVFLFSQCDPGFTEIEGGCYWDEDLTVIQEMIDNSGETLHMTMDDNDNGAIDPLELGYQDWVNGRLVEMGCYFCGISGNFPENMGNLSQLVSLTLGGNQITGPLPESFGSMTLLESLHLNGNQISGSLPDALGDMESLESVHLHDNELTGSIPASLGNLDGLRYLYLSRNSLSGSLPEQLGNLSQLLHLYLDYNQLTGTLPEQIGGLTSLQSMLINDNNFYGTIPAGLGSLNNLEYLWLQNNHFTGVHQQVCDSNVDWYQVNCGLTPFFLIGNNALCEGIPICITDATYFDYSWDSLSLEIVYDPQICGWYVPGDTNLDGAADILDIVMMVDIILENQEADPYQFGNSDLNGDNAMDILDIIIAVGIILDE